MLLLLLLLVLLLLLLLLPEPTAALHLHRWLGPSGGFETLAVQQLLVLLLLLC